MALKTKNNNNDKKAKKKEEETEEEEEEEEEAEEEEEEEEYEEEEGADSSLECSRVCGVPYDLVVWLLTGTVTASWGPWLRCVDPNTRRGAVKPMGCPRPMIVHPWMCSCLNSGVRRGDPLSAGMHHCQRL